MLKVPNGSISMVRNNHNITDCYQRRMKSVMNTKMCIVANTFKEDKHTALCVPKAQLL